MGFMDVFDAVLKIPNVTSGIECVSVLRHLNTFAEDDLAKIEKNFKGSIPIKKLFMIAEMAVQGQTGTLFERFFQCLQDYGQTAVKQPLDKEFLV